jgi:hypothetical protein
MFTPTPHIPTLNRLAAALAAAALMVPAAAHAKPADFVGGAAKQSVVKPSQDLRSADTRDVTKPAPVAHGDLGVDETVVASAMPEPTSPIQVSSPSSVPATFSWSDAGIGAGIALALALLGFGAIALTNRRTERRLLVS